MECWGADGVNHTRNTTIHYGGISGYVSGVISLGKKTLYVYVGDQAGFNGGGLVGPAGQLASGSHGGGATDIRLKQHNDTQYNTAWGGNASLYTRIIVAAGGGGANNRFDGYGEGDGGYGGGLTGGTGQTINNSGQNSYYICYGGEQEKGGSAVGVGGYANKTDGATGAFGYAQQYGITWNILIQSAAGGGWYGGGAMGHSGGGGGSSFISGMTGCSGIDNSTGAHRGAGYPSVIDGVTYTFNNTGVMYAGNSASRPTNPGGVVGYAKITSQ